jgi:hypothetical protein
MRNLMILTLLFGVIQNYPYYGNYNCKEPVFHCAINGQRWQNIFESDYWRAMEFIKLIISPYDSYNYNGASNIEMNILGNFLSSDVRCQIQSYREWAFNDLYRSACGNITSLDKENGNICLSDLYSEEEIPTELKMTIQQFVQLLDDWEIKVCKTKPKEVLIKHENGEFIIETKG